MSIIVCLKADETVGAIVSRLGTCLAPVTTQRCLSVGSSILYLSDGNRFVCISSYLVTETIRSDIDHTRISLYHHNLISQYQDVLLYQSNYLYAA